MASILYKNVYLKDQYSIATNKETKSGIKYNEIIKDLYYGEKTFEKAESKMQRKSIDKIIEKSKEKIDLLVGGDLSNQTFISNITASYYDIPYLSCYAACSTFTESMLLASTLIDTRKINNAIVFTSSHVNVSEKQFRYPIEYGSPKYLRTTITATGASAILLTNEKTNIKVTSSTIGKVIDYKLTDANNLGAVMAPACADTLINHLKELNIKENYYDLILTGDLGRVGKKLFIEILKENNINIKNYEDAGAYLYNSKNFNVSGSSGPITLPLVLLNKVLKEKKYKKILLLASGALHSRTSINQKETIRAISHAISLEVSNDVS